MTWCSRIERAILALVIAPAIAGCWDAPEVLATIDEPAGATVTVRSCPLDPDAACSDVQPLDGDPPWIVAVFVEGEHAAVGLDVCPTPGSCTRVNVPLAGAPRELAIHVVPFSVEGCDDCETVP